jgi:hypothetical protein
MQPAPHSLISEMLVGMNLGLEQSPSLAAHGKQCRHVKLMSLQVQHCSCFQVTILWKSHIHWDSQQILQQGQLTNLHILTSKILPSGDAHHWCIAEHPHLQVGLVHWGDACAQWATWIMPVPSKWVTVDSDAHYQCTAQHQERPVGSGNST